MMKRLNADPTTEGAHAMVARTGLVLIACVALCFTACSFNDSSLDATGSSTDTSAETSSTTAGQGGGVLPPTDTASTSSTGVAPGSRESVPPGTAECDSFDSEVRDIPGRDNTDRNCDGVVGERARAVFVSEDGDDEGAGRPDDPVASLQRAVALAAEEDRDHIYLQSGTYEGTTWIEGLDELALFGGYDEEWMRPLRADTTLRSPTPRTLVLRNITGDVRLDELVIESGDGNGDGEWQSSIAVWAEGVGGELRIEYSTLHAGRGSGGAHGDPGTTGADGANGLDGTVGCLVEIRRGITGNLSSMSCFDGDDGVEFSALRQGGSGAEAVTCDDGETAEAGGRGGDGAEGITPQDEDVGYEGMDGATAGGADGGIGGDGASCDSDAQDGADGEPGADGAPGADGERTDGQQDGEWIDEDWVALSGEAGRSGNPGEPGAGGGGGGGRDQCGGGRTRYFQHGGGGGGGGTGGCGGLGGGGGMGGGGSFALAVRSAGEVVLHNALLRTDGGGDGGDGAAGGQGGAGGDGGSGARGGLSTADRGNGGSGGAGGDGGSGARGGSGAGGAGGTSAGILADPQSSISESGDVTFDIGPAGDGGLGAGDAESGADGVTDDILRRVP